MDGRSLKSDERLPTLGSMQQPIKVDLPHKLGRDEARRRIANNIHKLKDHIPGGAAHVDSTWNGDDLDLTVHAMGQAVETRIGVEETKVRVEVLLPGMLALFAGPIEAMLQKKGNVLLEDKRD
jgi:putative polyhydroxyalkanoate system protein